MPRRAKRQWIESTTISLPRVVKQVDQGPHVERLGVSLDRSQGSSKNTHSMMA